MFTSDQFVSHLKKRIRLPDNTFEDDQDLLDFATIALTQDLLPELITMREEFYVKAEIFTVPAGSSFRIPSRAYSGDLREIKLINSDDSYTDLLRTYEEDLINTTTIGTPNVFLIRGNRIHLFPISSQPVDLFVTYWLAPPSIVPVAECAIITAINGNIVTCVPPTDWTTSNIFDLVKGTSDYEPVLLNQTVSAIAADQITFTNAPDIEVGDYVCLANQSPYAYLQSAYYPVLIQLTISLIHEALGDLEQKGASDIKAEALLKRIGGVSQTRIQGSPTKIVSPF